MTKHYTDEQLRDLRRLPKRVANPGARWIEKPSNHPIHRQRVFRAVATTEDNRELTFLVYMRLNVRDDRSFSCGIVYLPRGAPKLTLARYNGPSHEHGNIRYKPHIHRATEAAIAAGRKPEDAAEQTSRYHSLEGALACLIDDYKLSGVRSQPDHPSLFHDHQS